MTVTHPTVVQEFVVHSSAVAGTNLDVTSRFLLELAICSFVQPIQTTPASFVFLNQLSPFLGSHSLEGWAALQSVRRDLALFFSLTKVKFLLKGVRLLAPWTRPRLLLSFCNVLVKFFTSIYLS